jgi:hypothetical protein
MKVKIIPCNGGQMIIQLAPESDEDKAELKAFAGGVKQQSAMMINCRGFEYLKPEVEFLLQPMPRGD